MLHQWAVMLEAVVRVTWICAFVCLGEQPLSQDEGNSKMIRDIFGCFLKTISSIYEGKNGAKMLLNP